MFPARILAIGTLAGAPVAQAALVGEPGGAVKRAVVVLTTTDGDAEAANPAHALLQMPLNHLGIVARIHDVRAGQPPDGSLSGARAVITWFGHGHSAPPWLWPFLETAAAVPGMRFVHFGGFGPLADPGEGGADAARLPRWLQRLGLEWDPAGVADPFRIDVESIDPRLCNYESAPIFERAHAGPRSVAARDRVWVETRDREKPLDRRTPVVTGPWGGLALAPWAVRPGSIHDDRRWYIDPFRFFAEALGLEGVPAPDPCVLNGRRMFVFHVDGDGFESLSTVRQGASAARVMLDEVIDRYALPMTISVIVAGLTDDFRVAAPTPRMQLAREILNRPWVEPASHTVLHPLDWRRELGPRALPRSVVWYPEIANYRHDMRAEVRESIRFIDERLLEGGRKCRVMLWSGMTNPGEDVLLEAERAGACNLNGGEYRWDERTDSVGFVAPWGRQVGSAFQVYCGAANENGFDGFYATMPGAFGHVERTLANTGRGRILKPANVYAHFYSAERPARLAALRRLIEHWAFEAETAPVFASTYALAVHAAQTRCRIERAADGWSFREFAGCRTARIDGETRSIDWRRSRGLLGARRMNGALFVHLAAADADLVWSSAPALDPHIEQADHELTDAELTPRSVAVRSAAFARRTIVFAGFPPGAELRAEVDGGTDSVRADGAGRFEWSAGPGSGRVRISVP